MKKPITTTADWQDGDARTVSDLPGWQTKPGRHPMERKLAQQKEKNIDRRAKILRDYGGRKRDPRRIRPPEHADSGRTWKSSSKIRFPSEAYRRNFTLVNWSA